METFVDYISSLLTDWNVGVTHVKWLTTLVSFTVVAIVSWGIYKLLSRVVNRYVIRLVEFTEVKWDDVIFNPKVLDAIWQLMLTMLLYKLLPDCFKAYPSMESFIHGFCKILVVLGWVQLIVRILRALFNLFSSLDRFAENSFNGICQLFQLLTICGGIIIIVSILIGRDPVFVLSGLGAVAAVLMLVFQDTIMGFVAGIQMTANDMLKPGDWIAAPKYNINGTVLEVNLTTVKVQNFDMTIVTVPPYALVKDSFQNWRGMFDAGGRRIMRSFNIDMTTIRPASADELEKFAAEEWWQPEFAASGKPINLTLFRHYLKWYISGIPSLNREMTYMVRELQPTPEGVPVEVYFFTKETTWVVYEGIQAEAVDQMLAATGHFGLKLFQRPTGADLRRAAL